MKKRILSFLLLAAMICFGIAPAAAFAKETHTSVWDGNSAAESYQSGDGSAAAPYEIATAEQFAYFAKQIANGKGTDASYVLAADLDMTATSWTPIGMDIYSNYAMGNYFQGKFDGQGHSVKYKISDLESTETYSAIGLFGYAAGEIKDLIVEGTISDLPSLVCVSVGGIAGLFDGDIVNCVSKVDFTLTDGKTNQCRFGGITGEHLSGTIENSLYSGEINLTFSECYADLYVGGIAGSVYGGKIYACKNKGNIALANTESNKINNGNAGGIVGIAITGYKAFTSEIQDCYNEGAVSAQSFAGGIAAKAHAIFSETHNVDVCVKISNCYSSASVVAGLPDSGCAICPDVETFNYADNDASATAIVENCYYTVGEDENATEVPDVTEIYAKLCAASVDGLWIKDAKGTPRLFWKLKAAATPTATFSATGDSCGVLGGVDASVKYSTDGGNTWFDVSDTSVEITGVSADNDVKVYRVGDMLTTSDSEVQTIDITKAQKPTVAKSDCTTLAQNDGSITGLDNTMEYRAEDDATWTSVSGESVTGLAVGKYYVRVKAQGNALASECAQIVIEKHVCAAGADDWHYDSTEHWNACDCGEKQNKAEHTFKWITDKYATADESGWHHEECSVCGYAKAGVEIPKLNDGNNPSTGDDGDVLLYLALILLSSGAAVVAVGERKKKYSKK